MAHPHLATILTLPLISFSENESPPKLAAAAAITEADRDCCCFLFACCYVTMISPTANCTGTLRKYYEKLKDATNERKK